MNKIWIAFFVGLEDYTVNERGDVGSWVRSASIQGLCSIIETFIISTRSPEPIWAMNYVTFSQYVPLDTYHKAIGMILKQGVERLDNVRQCVGRLFPLLLALSQGVLRGLGGGGRVLGSFRYSR